MGQKQSAQKTQSHMPTRSLSQHSITISPRLRDIDPDQVDDFALRGRHIVQIVDVYDGDTVTFIIVLGIDFPLKLKLRLLGCDAPEMRGKTQQEREDAERARGRIIELIGWRYYRPGMATWAEVELTGWDKYGGRVVGILYTRDNMSVTDILIREKLARPYDGGKKQPYQHME